MYACEYLYGDVCVHEREESLPHGKRNASQHTKIRRLADASLIHSARIVRRRCIPRNLYSFYTYMR